MASVAAHFDITPSELAILNRLPSRNVFPGQVIRVPDRRRCDDSGSDDKENKHDNPSEPAADDTSQGCDDEMGECCFSFCSLNKEVKIIVNKTSLL